MQKNVNVFKRYEKKYRLNEETYEKLLQQLQNSITKDHFGLHTICNIYNRGSLSANHAAE